jgi:UDP-N-acetylmuramoyl-L-alanyl-D-glutamate--2,6-diaminopimelate ligase
LPGAAIHGRSAGEKSEDAAMTSGVTVEAIAAALAGARVIRGGEARVSGAHQDSRKVEPGALFCVRRGAKSDGRAFVADAIARGATAMLTDDAALAAEAELPAILVPDARAAIGAAALEAYGRPDRRVDTIGITGTNGKTTTTHLTRAMLERAGRRAAVLGTLGAFFEGIEIPATHTTPEGDEIARVLARLADAGASHLVMEVSSHALSLARVDALRFAIAAYTNLTQDHLDFHGDMGSYGEAKARLFTALSPARSVVCVDDAFGAGLARRAVGERITVSARGEVAADLRVVESSIGAGGIAAKVTSREGTVELVSRLVGAHNLENLMVALGIGAAAGLDLGEAARALAEAPAVPGRLERCSEPGDDVLVVVDYAHTPDALERVLAALRPLTTGEVWCVFGCGGDRDPAKRPRMGEAVARGADRVAVTNDNPRGEAPDAIADAIVPGLERLGRAYERILDRAEAIAWAVRSAAPGDAVLVAGKGHETYQIVGDGVRPFDDRVEARRALAARREAAR